MNVIELSSLANPGITSENTAHITRTSHVKFRVLAQWTCSFSEVEPAIIFPPNVEVIRLATAIAHKFL